MTGGPFDIAVTVRAGAGASGPESAESAAVFHIWRALLPIKTGST